jgi:hypothetical protein
MIYFILQKLKLDLKLLCLSVCRAGRLSLSASRRLILSTSFFLLAGFSSLATADETTLTNNESEVLFVRRISPLLREKCLGCHGQDAELIEGSIDFRAIEPLTAGGDSGEAGIVPGKPNESSIFLAAARGDPFSPTQPVTPGVLSVISDQVSAEVPETIEGRRKAFADWTPNPKPQQRNRRSIYVLKLRGLVDPSLEVFNSPSPDFSCEKRDTSTVTPQVFAMFNSDNSNTRALALADAAMGESENPTEVVQWLYRRLFARHATDVEVARCLDHWQRIESMMPPKAPPHAMPPREVVREAVEENTGENFTFVETLYAIDDFEPDLQPSQVDRRTRALADVCLVLMNSNEFIYVY